MTIEEWLGKDNQLGVDIWQRKYCYENEDFDHWIERISGGNQDIARLIRERSSCSGEGSSPTGAWNMWGERSPSPTVM